MTSANQPISPESATEGLAAIVLAAGYSSRMGEFKPLLPLGGVSALARSIHLFQTAGIREVIAVLGHRAGELRPIAERYGARCVINPHYEQGMYSSIVAGCAALPADVKGAFALPADIPLVRPSTIRQLATAYAQHGADVTYPMFSGRRGHPPFIGPSILMEILQGARGPLSALLASREDNALDVQVADEAIHKDMDTPSDYLTLRELVAHRDVPTESEVEAILEMHHVSPAVVQHSLMVARIAHALGSALLHRGVILNLDLVRAGAMLHDLCKGRPAHAAAGAAILFSLGFPGVAAIVAAHSDLRCPWLLDESATVFLADKLVRGEDLVTLADRFQPAMERFRTNARALEAANRRLLAAQMVAAKVEAKLEMDLFAALREQFGGAVLASGPSVASEVVER